MRLEGWPRVRAVHPSFETPCCARLLKMRSEGCAASKTNSPGRSFAAVSSKWLGPMENPHQKSTRWNLYTAGSFPPFQLESHS